MRKFRTQIFIKLDAGLPQRVDRLAAEIGVRRWSVMERAVRSDLSEQAVGADTSRRSV